MNGTATYVIQPRIRPLALIKQDGAVVIDVNESRGAKNSPTVRPFTRVRVPLAVDTRRRPWATAELQMSSTSIRDGGFLVALCQIDTSESEDHADGWWTRTPQGWVSNEKLDIVGVQVPGLRTCGARALEP